MAVAVYGAGESGLYRQGRDALFEDVPYNVDPANVRLTAGAGRGAPPYEKRG